MNCTLMSRYFELQMTYNFSASSDIIMDLSCKLQKPSVALVHQMPFYTDIPGFAGTIDKVRYLIISLCIIFHSLICHLVYLQTF